MARLPLAAPADDHVLGDPVAHDDAHGNLAAGVDMGDQPGRAMPCAYLLERAAAAGQLTPAEVEVYRSKFASAEAGSECLRALVKQWPQPPAASC